MEGADPIITPWQARDWFELGLRVVGPVHYGHNQYAHGTNESGRLTPLGVELLRELHTLGIILDTTHLSDEGFLHALDVFSGPVIASHQNCRALVPGCRQFTDEQLRLLIERDAVIGVAFDNWMIVPGWTTGQTPRSEATLEKLADHIDHICQLAGDHRHAAIGTDLDGGFGSEQKPYGNRNDRGYFKVRRHAGGSWLLNHRDQRHLSRQLAPILLHAPAQVILNRHGLEPAAVPGSSSF